MKKNLDSLIFGLGLAGANLADELGRRGHPFHAFDDGDPGAASRVAAGLISPLSGQRTALQWRIEALLPRATATYGPYYHPMPILRVFQNEEQRRLFLARKAEPKHAPWLSDELPQAYFTERGIHAPLGGIEVKGGGWLDSAAWIGNVRATLKASDQLSEAPVDFSQIQSDAHGVHYAGFSARRAIFCLGVRARSEGPFKSLPFQPTRGDLLTVESKIPSEANIYYGSHFAIPIGGHRFRVGATYDRLNLVTRPKTSDRALLHNAVSSLFTNLILKHQHGLRPNMLGHFPVLGPLPNDPNFWVFNGLGSKGAIWAPACAQWLADSIEKNQQIPNELSVTRFFS